MKTYYQSKTPHSDTIKLKHLDKRRLERLEWIT